MLNLFQLYEGDSFLHGLNPLTKLGLAVVVMLVLTLVIDPITPLVVASETVLATWLLGRLRPTTYLRWLAPFVLVAIGVFWTTAAFYLPGPGAAPRVLTTIGPFGFSDQGVAYGLTIAFRILGVFAASLLFVLTTDPSDLVQALIQQWRVSYRFGYGALAAYRFVPLFESELATIRAAHRIRGVGGGGGPAARYHRFVGYLVPLLAGGVRKAERVALAMDARGFGAYPTRTFYRRSRFGRHDLAFAVGAGVVLAATLLGLARLGWLGQLIPPFVSW
jgi:energy-coupling factor transport system permease protein